jgi:outer membrane protein OmpA-like peptidoglycan-associated protein
MKSSGPFFGALCLGCWIVGPANALTPLPECEGNLAVRSALAANDIAGAEAAFGKAVESCGANDQLGHAIAAAKYNKAIESTPPDEKELLAALAFGRPWQLLATLGDLAMARRDYKLAAQRFQEALVEIDDRHSTIATPAEAMILKVKQKAEQAGLLSPDYVATPRSRDGSNAGLAASEIRGIAIGVVAFPVQFEFDSTAFTRSGAEAAGDMAGFLKNEKKPIKIVLVGHTDPRGETEYNQDLSQRRAAALAAFLRAEGVTLEITSLGKGESEPYRPDDPAKYTEEEIFQMDRRVELRRQQ